MCGLETNFRCSTARQKNFTSWRHEEQQRPCCNNTVITVWPGRTVLSSGTALDSVSVLKVYLRVSVPVHHVLPAAVSKQHIRRQRVWEALTHGHKQL